MKDFNARLSELLEEKGISGYRLAKEIRISTATISNYLNGKSKPNRLILRELSSYFRVSAQWLLTGEGERALRCEKPSGLSAFSDNEIVRYIIKHVKSLVVDPVFYSYLEMRVVGRLSELVTNRHFQLRDERLGLSR